MNILAVDDEIISLKNLELKLKKAVPQHSVFSFTSPESSLDWIKDNNPDIAILDIDLGKMNGLDLGRQIKEKRPECAIIFLTGYEKYAVSAFKIKASGYLLKPVNTEDLIYELNFVANSKQQKPIVDKNLRAQCFGSFEVFYDNKPLSFKRAKSKELFAYLISRRGTSATMAEIADVLWEDGIYNPSRNNQIHCFLHDLMTTLKEVGETDLIIRSRNAISVDSKKIHCDFYDCMNGDPAVINSYRGEFMSQYSWAEFVTGRLTMML